MPAAAQLTLGQQTQQQCTMKILRFGEHSSVDAVVMAASRPVFTAYVAASLVAVLIVLVNVCASSHALTRLVVSHVNFLVSVPWLTKKRDLVLCAVRGASKALTQTFLGRGLSVCLV